MYITSDMDTSLDSVTGYGSVPSGSMFLSPNSPLERAEGAIRLCDMGCVSHKHSKRLLVAPKDDAVYPSGVGSVRLMFLEFSY